MKLLLTDASDINGTVATAARRSNIDSHSSCGCQQKQRRRQPRIRRSTVSDSQPPPMFRWSASTSSASSPTCVGRVRPSRLLSESRHIAVGLSSGRKFNKAIIIWSALVLVNYCNGLLSATSAAPAINGDRNELDSSYTPGKYSGRIFSFIRVSLIVDPNWYDL